VSSMGLEAVGGLVDASIGLVLVAKWTVVLVLAWLAHAALWRRDPRWRVVLWRGALVGVAMVAVLSSAAPIVTYPLALSEPTSAGQPEESLSPASSQPAPTAIPDASISDQALERRLATDARRVDQPVYGIASSRQLAGTSRPMPAPARSPLIGDGVRQAGESRRVEPPAMPAPVSRWVHRIGPWLGGIWLVGVLMLSIRLIVGSLGLFWLVRRSADVPEEVIQECRTIAGRLRCARVVGVRRSVEVTTPCLTGLVRPILLLPDREWGPSERDDLRAILAHELTHARNQDLHWNLAANLASILLWFHPLAWRIRAAHAAACDAICDAVAADLVGDVASYSRTLARLAVRAAGKSPVHGLAMARTSDVRRRLDALNRRVFRAPLSWRRVMLALFVCSLLLLPIAGLGFTRAERAAPGPSAEQATAGSVPKADAAAKPANEQAAGKLTLRAVAAKTGEPIEGVSIEYLCVSGDKRQEATIFTGEDGTAVIEWAPGAVVRRLWLTASEPNYVPIHILWDDERHPVELPEVKELRFEPGTTIGGILHDEAGRPVEGATVDVHAPATEYEGRTYFFTLGSPKSDAQGRWRLDVAPKDLAGVWGRTNHPHYRNSDVVASRNLDSVTILKKGLTVSGRVVDAAGRPVNGARAIIGHDTWGGNPPTASTNERGQFTLENCDSGPSIITVQADGFAPRIEDVRIDERTAPVEFQLAEPGSLLRVRVVDVRGKPVVGARVFADTWRGHRSIHFRADTDPQGRFEWRSAPKDVVLYEIGKPDYMWHRSIPLTASKREQTVILYPELVISGRVTDAQTGRPVPKFRVVKGWQAGWQVAIHWSENMGVELSGGQYTASFSDPREALFVKIEAPGYTASQSRAFRPNEGRQTLDFALERAVGISGIVLLSDGKPAEGAEVALSTWQSQVRLRSGKFDPNADFPKTSTGPDGRFTFPPRADKFFLIALSDAGFAEASSEEFAKSGKLVLQAWGRIEGGVRIGARTGANQEVAFLPIRPAREAGIDRYSYGSWTWTDERGRFQFDRVVPGPGTVARVVRDSVRPGTAFRQLPCWQERVEVKPGQMTQVTVGGKGRPVIGRVVLDGTPEAPVDWTDNEPVLLGVPPEDSDPSRFGLLSRGSTLFASHIDKDGRFRIDDVPAGKFELELVVSGQRAPIARVKTSVVVPAIPVGRSNEPLDLGTITTKLFDAIKIGDRAPDFDVERIGTETKGQRLKLSDYRGKLVLLNFWEARNEQNHMTVLKEVQQTFGGDPRFVLISLACGTDAAQAEQSIKQDGLSWTHGFAGDFDAGAATGYKIRAIPYAYAIGPDEKQRWIPVTFLIGPDGRIVAHDLAGTDLEAVRKALENPKFFPTAAKAADRAGYR